MNATVQTPHSQAATIERSWRLVCFLLIVAFILRGVALLAILPPLEGWDEYQHLARIAFVVEQGRSPTLRESMVPRSLFPAIAALPHGPRDIEQTGRVGALPYLADENATPRIRSYWDGPPPAPSTDAPDIALYQAQHGPLYYWMMTPIYKALWDPSNPLDCIYALRLANLAFGAAALAAVLWTLTRLVSSVQPRIWIALLLAVQPLFLLNIARIANDAPAVLFGIGATGLLMVHGRRGSWHVAVAAAALTGLAVLSKSVALVILPLAVAAPLFGWWRRETNASRAFGKIACFFMAFSLVTANYFYSNWQTYGIAVPMQESIRNHENGRVLSDTLAAVGQIDWWRQLRSRVTRDSLWVGGWSFITLPAGFRGVHEGLIAVALGGLLLGLIRRRNRRNEIESMDRPWFDSATIGLMAIVVAGSLGGLAYHTVQSKLAYNTITTNVWYACLVFPWMIALLVFGFDRFRARAAPIWVGAMMALCLTSECYGLFVEMVGGYSGLEWSEEARLRLASVHPTWLWPGMAIPLEWVAVALALAVYRISLRRKSISPPSRPQPSDPQRDPAR